MKALDVDRFARRWCMVLFIVSWSLANLCRSVLQAQASYYTENGQQIWQLFKRPVFLNIIMSLSMIPALLVDFVRKKCSSTPETSTKIPSAIWMIVPVASLLDIVQCWTMNRAFSDVGVTLGSLIVALDVLFIALIKWIFLKIPLMGYGIFSIGIVIIAIVLSFVSDVESNTSPVTMNAQSIVTLCLQIFGEILRSILFVMEEYILHNTDLSPELFVGALGFYNLLITLFIHSPIAYFIHDPSYGQFYENMCTSFEMLSNSKQATYACLCYLVISFFMNIINTRYIYYTGALQISICSGFSASINWATGIIVALCGDDKNPSPLSKFFSETRSTWSVLKLFMYIAILFALLVFSRVIELPCFTYPEETRYIVSMDDVEK